MTLTGIEKRRHKRIDCEIQSAIKTTDENGRPSLLETTVQDISEGGVRFRINKFIPVRDRVWVKLNIPRSKPIEVLTKPAWIRELPSIGQYDIGAQFLTLTDEDRRLIQSFVGVTA